MKGNREHTYVTHTLAEHHRIVREGNRFKKDMSKMQEYISRFQLEVNVSNRKLSKDDIDSAKDTVDQGGGDKKTKKKVKRKSKAKTSAEQGSKGPGPTPVSSEEKLEEKLKRKKQKKASERLDKIKRCGRKRASRAEVDSMLKESLMRLSDWSQRAYDVMQRQMKDITKLYMATMDYNIHLNSAYPVVPPPQSNL